MVSPLVMLYRTGLLMGRQETNEPTAADRHCRTPGESRCPCRRNGLCLWHPWGLHAGRCLRSPSCAVFGYRVCSWCVRGKRRRNWNVAFGRPPNNCGICILTQPLDFVRYDDGSTLGAGRTNALPTALPTCSVYLCGTGISIGSGGHYHRHTWVVRRFHHSGSYNAMSAEGRHLLAPYQRACSSFSRTPQ